MKQVWSVLRYALLGGALVFFVFPLFWIVMTGFKTGSEFMAWPPVWLPRSPTLDHYRIAFSSGGIKALWNSLSLAALATMLSVAVGAPAAFGLARFRVGGHFLPTFFLSQRMLPPIALALPIFMFFRGLKLIDTYLGILLVYMLICLPYTVWMLRGFFMEIPEEVEESAMVDGCSPVQVFWHVALPLVRAGIIATAAFAYIFAWSDFLFGLILTRSRVLTLPVFMTGLFGTQMTMWGELGALSTIAVIPMFVLSLLTQRHLVRGLTMGAIK